MCDKCKAVRVPVLPLNFVGAWPPIRGVLGVVELCHACAMVLLYRHCAAMNVEQRIEFRRKLVGEEVEYTGGE